MAGSLCAEGAADFFRGALGALPGPAGIPQTANLVAEVFTPGWLSTFKGLPWAAGSFALQLRNGWAFALQAGANYLAVQQTVAWTFAPASAGLVFYGVGIYDPVVQELFYCEAFPAPYVVPSTGSTLRWTFNFNFGNCGQP